jgi:hypothetical protein
MPSKKVDSASELSKRHAKAVADFKYLQEERRAKEKAENESLLAAEKKRIERDIKTHERTVEARTKKT